MAFRGELERRIMEFLWAANAAVTVADIHDRILQERELAYTTVMTVLDRLAKKGLAKRELIGRAWSYEPAQPKPVFLAQQMLGVLEELDDDLRQAVLAEFANGLSHRERLALV